MIGNAKKTLTELAAEAINAGNTPAADLLGFKRAVNDRAEALEPELKRQRLLIEDAERTGDLSAVAAAEATLRNLKTEERVLLRMRGDLHKAFTTAQGREAAAEVKQLQKRLAAARDQAKKARDMLAEAEAEANAIATRRQHAAQVGESLEFDVQVVRSLAYALHGGNDDFRRKVEFNLGVKPTKRARPMGA